MQLPIRPVPLSSPLSVLCIIDTLGRGGGAEQLVASLAIPLRARGVELEFVDLFSWPDDLGVELQRQGFVVHRLELSHRWNLVQGLQRLRAIVSARQPMIVWGHLYFGNLYASLLGLCLPGMSSVITLHSTGLAQMTPRGLKSRLAGALERWINWRSHVKVAVSDAVRDAYCSRRGWTDVGVIHNGIDVDAIPVVASVEDRARVRERFDMDDDEFLITVPARFVAEKGHAVLLDAVAHLASQHELHPRFLLFGEQTPLVEALQARQKRLGILDGQLRFLSPVPQHELFTVLSCSDAAVLPSIQEAFGMAAVEAMATETPVILSRVGGMAELDPQGECAIYVPPGDARALGDAIASLMQEHGSRIARGRCGRRLAQERFSLDRCATAWQQLFLDIFSNPRHSAS